MFLRFFLLIFFLLTRTDLARIAYEPTVAVFDDARRLRFCINGILVIRVADYYFSPIIMVWYK